MLRAYAQSHERRSYSCPPLGITLIQVNTSHQLLSHLLAGLEAWRQRKKLEEFHANQKARGVAVTPAMEKRFLYFTDGMTDAVTTELAKLGVSKVISETSVAQFKDTKKSVPEIARALEVDAVVERAVLREGNQVRITVQLIRGDTDRHVWAESYERQMTDILALQDEVALGVAHAIKLELSPGTAGQSSSPRPVNTEAYEAYLKGRYFLQKRDESALRAKDYFEHAIQLDPSYAPAYAGLSQFLTLADVLPAKEALPKAKEYAQRTLKLDANLPESHISLAYIYFYDDWNWPAADQEFQRAISLAPGLAESHRWYAVYLAAIGRATEAMREAERAVDLDPLSISAHDGAAIAAACGGQYDRTIEEAHKILELDPNDPRAYADMTVGHLQKRMYQEALQDAEKGLAISHRYPTFLSFAAFVHGRLGQMEEAGKLGDNTPFPIVQQIFGQIAVLRQNLQPALKSARYRNAA